MLTKINVDVELSSQVNKKFNTVRYNCALHLNDVNGTGQGIVLTPNKALDADTYQLIFFEKKAQKLLQSEKGTRLRNCEAEAGRGLYDPNKPDDYFYFIRVKMSESVTRTFFLSNPQKKLLKYINLGFEFGDIEPSTDVTEEELNEIKVETQPKSKKD